MRAGRERSGGCKKKGGSRDRGDEGGSEKGGLMGISIGATAAWQMAVWEAAWLKHQHGRRVKYEE